MGIGQSLSGRSENLDQLIRISEQTVLETFCPEKGIAKV